MTHGTVVVFLHFLTLDAPKLEPWRDHCRRVTGAEPPVVDGGFADGPGDGSAYVWSLYSGNNRPLARSVALYSNLEDAVDSAVGSIAMSRSFHVEEVDDPSRSLYGWHAGEGGSPLVSCARWYVNARERRASVDSALIALSEAVIHPGSRVIDPTLMAATSIPLDA